MSSSFAAKFLGTGAAEEAAHETQATLAELQAEADAPDFYRSYIIRARPQMAFAAIEKNGTAHGFMYHTLRRPKHEVVAGHEHLSFTADGLAVTMQGKGLKILFHALLRHTLAEVREYDSKPEQSGVVTKVERLTVDDPRDFMAPARPAG